MKDVFNIILLHKKVPIPGHGWGCLQCNLPPDGAVAVLCHKCMAKKAEPKFACRGYPANEGRIPIDELKGGHEHDWSKHPEDEHESF